MKEKQYSFSEFQDFLNDKCWDLKKWKEGKYDRKIYNWFDVGKPRKVDFLKADGSFKKYIKKK